MKKERRSELSNLDRGYKEEIVKLSKGHLKDKRVLEEKYLFEVESLKSSVDEFKKSLCSEQIN